MRSFTNIISAAAVFFLAQLFISWTTVTKNTAAVRSDTFSYEFYEPNHVDRINYRITVTTVKIYFVVEAFTKIVYADTLKISSKKYNEFVKALTALHITSRQRTEGPCIGSSSEYFKLYVGTRKELKGMYMACNPGASTLAGDLPVAAGLFQALIPGLEEKLDKMREE